MLDGIFQISNKRAVKKCFLKSIKITIKNKKLELKFQNHNLGSSKHLNVY